MGLCLELSLSASRHLLWASPSDKPPGTIPNILCLLSLQRKGEKQYKNTTGTSSGLKFLPKALLYRMPILIREQVRYHIKALTHIIVLGKRGPNQAAEHGQSYISYVSLPFWPWIHRVYFWRFQYNCFTYQKRELSV